MATKLWVHPEKAFYRLGNYYRPGEPFEIPESEKPPNGSVPASEYYNVALPPLPPARGTAMSEMAKTERAARRPQTGKD